MTSSMLFGDRRLASSRRGAMTVLGKVPKPINLPSQRLENHGIDPNVEIVPKGTLSWGSRSSSASNAWGSSSLSPNADGGTTSPSHLSGHLSSGSGTRPSTAGSDKGHEASANAWGPNSRPSSASGALTSNQTILTSLRPRSAETRPGSSQLSRFAEHSEHPVAWSAPGTAEKLGVMSSKNDGFSLTSGDFPTLGSEKDNPGKNAESQDHSSYRRPGSSSGSGVAKETTGTSVVGDVSANANVKSGTANSWKKENPSYSEDGGRLSMEKWQGHPHPYPSANGPPHHYEGWHGGPVANPQGGVWYRGPPGATPYAVPVPPGGFPMESFTYFPPPIPAAALANPQSVPPPGAGPRGHHPKNGDMYRPHMQDAYIRPGMPIRPGFYPGPVAFEGYYNSPMGYCNPNERDVPFVGMPSGPSVYNRYPSQSAHEHGNSHVRPSGYGPTNQTVMPEQLESGHPHDSRGPYKVLLKQHDGWDIRNEEQRAEGAVTTNVSCREEDQPRMLVSENDWRSDHRKEGEKDQRKVLGEEVASHNYDNRGACSVPIKAADVISVKKLGTEASVTPEVAQPFLAAAKDSSLIQKIEGLNAKARVSDGRNDPASVSSREEQKNRFQVNAKANNSVNEPVSGFVHPDKSHATEIVNPSHEVGFSAGDKNQSTAGSGISISRRSNHGVHGRSDYRGRGRFNNQEGEGWGKKSMVSEPTTVVSTAHLEIPANVYLHDHPSPVEASEMSGSYPQGRCEEESVTPLFDPSDSEAQRAKMRELAKQRIKQLQEEEEERTRRQMAKARAKLEELNRRTQVVDGSNEKFENHASGAIQNKQEESQTSGEPLMAGRKSALGSNLNAVSESKENSSKKVEKSTVPSSELPSERLKSAYREPVLMHGQSVPLQREVIVANAVHHNDAPQTHESDISRQKQVPKQKQNNQLEKKSTGKSNSTSMAEATNCLTDVEANVSVSLGVVTNETASSSESSLTANSSPRLESSSHPRKKNNRNGKNKHKTENASLVAALPSSISKETNVSNATFESGRPKAPELVLDPSSVQLQNIPGDAYQSLEQQLPLSNDESQGRVHSQWKPQHSRRMSRNSQTIKHSEKLHSTDAVVWAPVRSQNKADVTDEAFPKNEVEGVSAAKSDHKVQNNSKNKRAEIERYVPKPVAKEMAHQGSTQQPVASIINHTAINVTIERADSGSQGAESSPPTTVTVGKVGITIESRNGSSRQNKHGKAHGSWRQRGPTDSTTMQGPQDGPSYPSNVGQSDKKSIQHHQPQKRDVGSVIEQPKSSDDWNFSDGWNMPDEPVVGPVSVPIVKDQGITGRGKQHLFKGHKAMGNNHEVDQKKNSRGEVDKFKAQSSASEMGQTELPAASKESRAVGERAMPHWQPKPQSFAANNQGVRAGGGQNVGVEVGRTIQKETSPRGRVSLPPTPDKDTTDYVAEHRRDQLISERNNAGEGQNKGERKVASFRGRPRSPDQGPVNPVELAPASMDSRQEQHFHAGFRKNGTQNSRFGRGQESRGDWSNSGHDTRQHNPPANRERQRNSSHYEYQPVGPYNNNSKSNNSEGPRDGSNNRGGRVKERGQSHPRRGGGNFHGRQSGVVQVDADME